MPLYTFIVSLQTKQAVSVVGLSKLKYLNICLLQNLFPDVLGQITLYHHKPLHLLLMFKKQGNLQNIMFSM